jgi:hypothetical protein
VDGCDPQLGSNLNILFAKVVIVYRRGSGVLVDPAAPPSPDIEVVLENSVIAPILDKQNLQSSSHWARGLAFALREVVV